MGKLNFGDQFYKGITLRLISRNYSNYNAMRYTLNGTNQNVWIPMRHLDSGGTIKAGEDIDYIFRRSHRQLELAGYLNAIPGIKRRSSAKYGICERCVHFCKDTRGKICDTCNPDKQIGVAASNWQSCVQTSK